MPNNPLLASGRQLKRLATPYDDTRALNPARQIETTMRPDDAAIAERMTRPAPVAQPLSRMPQMEAATADDPRAGERQLVDAIIKQAIAASRQPDIPQLPQYQPLPDDKRHGFKNRLIGGLRSLATAAQAGQTDLPSAIGMLLRGAINPEVAHREQFQMNDMAVGVRRQQQAIQQENQRQMMAQRQLESLTRAASAVRGMRDPMDISKIVTGGEYMMVINPRTGQYEVAHDKDGKPILSSSVATGIARNETNEKIAGDRIESAEKIAGQRIESSEKIASNRDKTSRQNTLTRTQTQREISAKNRQSAFERVQMSQEAQDRRAAARILSREPKPVTDDDVKNYRAAHPDEPLSDAEIKAALGGKSSLPNARGAFEWLGDWKSLKGGAR